MIDLEQKYIEDIRYILNRYVPNAQIRVFGSRIQGNANTYSDLDIAIVSDSALDPKIIRRLKDDFEFSELPFCVDILDWHQIAPEFQSIILKNYEILDLEA
ncbi:MAG: nucleotidyltransferase domain-containing protein [Deltaproteobacteria bacterium]|nr:nucleotidyltransferase domain-containing protein [Deltaproteobacteria bacterium]